MPLDAIDLAAKVHRLRAALETDFTLVSEILSSRLDTRLRALRITCSALSRPLVGPSKDLIVVTDGALGELPSTFYRSAPARVDVHLATVAGSAM